MEMVMSQFVFACVLHVHCQTASSQSDGSSRLTTEPWLFVASGEFFNTLLYRRQLLAGHGHYSITLHAATASGSG